MVAAAAVEVEAVLEGEAVWPLLVRRASAMACFCFLWAGWCFDGLDFWRQV